MSVKARVMVGVRDEDRSDTARLGRYVFAPRLIGTNIFALIRYGIEMFPVPISTCSLGDLFWY